MIFRLAVAVIAADRDLLQLYDPARAGELGPEFATLAVRRLARITDGYEAALASRKASA